MLPLAFPALYPLRVLALVAVAALPEHESETPAVATFKLVQRVVDVTAKGIVPVDNVLVIWPVIDIVPVARIA